MMHANLRVIRVSQLGRLVATQHLSHDCASDGLTLQVSSPVSRTSSNETVDRIH